MIDEEIGMAAEGDTEQGTAVEDATVVVLSL